ncbi:MULTISPECIES: DUF1810 domain-containing protein [Pseudomonas]|uniref:DUF1810 domain-containing protein n=1 Tax=Pseudomonas TaxID=286 RepID=UPI001BEB056F|nr:MULTISPECIES: DUF1810 domain-containing protein [Pseudomonas]MBT2339603.1 DUF1810 domain-containing protein [Pseudomonas fluorescens]MCD4528271.1 DUF1810 domain-containing protein [Pseudomonas sp. C3-2018]
MTDSLQRFVQAQASTFETAMRELEHGRKQSHWIWFIFPQLRGLGHSENAAYYGLRDLEEARDYLQHPLLGPRLEQATRAVLDSPVPIQQLLGELDAMKFASCMTLFSIAAGTDSLYARAPEGKVSVDLRTLEMLQKQSNDI